jgi:centromeric protein E
LVIFFSFNFHFHFHFHSILITFYNSSLPISNKISLAELARLANQNKTLIQKLENLQNQKDKMQKDLQQQVENSQLINENTRREFDQIKNEKMRLETSIEDERGKRKKVKEDMKLVMKQRDTDHDTIVALNSEKENLIAQSALLNQSRENLESLVEEKESLLQKQRMKVSQMESEIAGMANERESSEKKARLLQNEKIAKEEEIARLMRERESEKERNVLREKEREGEWGREKEKLNEEMQILVTDLESTKADLRACEQNTLELESIIADGERKKKMLGDELNLLQNEYAEEKKRLQDCYQSCDILSHTIKELQSETEMKEKNAAAILQRNEMELLHQKRIHENLNNEISSLKAKVFEIFFLFLLK